MRTKARTTKKNNAIFPLFLERFIPLAFFTLLSATAIYLLERSSHLVIFHTYGIIPSVGVSTPFTQAIQQHEFVTIAMVTMIALCIAAPVAWRRALRERTNTLMELQNQEHLRSIKLLLDSTQEGIYGTNQLGICIMANQSCALMLGYDSPEQLLGQHMHSLMHHSYADGSPYPEEECRAHRLAKEGPDALGVDNEVFWRRDGSSFPVSYNAYPIIEDEQIIGIVCTFVDISDRRALEEQLRHAQKMEAVGQLAGGIAHDFNNILQIISGNTQILQFDQLSNGSTSPRLQEILCAVERGTMLTRSMLAFSRKQSMFTEPLELNLLLKDSELLAHKLLTNDISLQLNLSSTTLLIDADATLLQQVIFNLVTNARDAMPDGGCITISTEQQVIDYNFIAGHGLGTPGIYAVLSIRDTGKGIPAELRTKIFEPFFTTKGTGKGTGLGLSMTYGTIKQHGGFIMVDSHEGSGSCFKIYLPLLGKEHVLTPDAERNDSHN